MTAPQLTTNPGSWPAGPIPAAPVPVPGRSSIPGTAPALAIDVRGLRKSFGKRVVLDGIDLRVPEASVFALLGPNGAGKTTVVHILATLLRPDRGEVTVGGFDALRKPAAVRRLIGLTGQVSAVDPQFTGEENLRLMADLHHLGSTQGRARVAELLERFDLLEVAKKQVQTWSGGMRRRLDLAMTLVGDPRIVFLDEPTTGLDPRSRRAVWDMIRDLAASGVTVFLTTQYLEEADRLAGRIALLDHGRVVADGTPAELKRLVPGGSVRLEFGSEADLDRAATTVGHGTRDEATLALEVPGDDGVHGLRALLDRLDDASVEVAGLSVRSADLDDVFLAMTGRQDGQEGSR
jgi:ABC-2 type transport system ATP-binding protein